MNCTEKRKEAFEIQLKQKFGAFDSLSIFREIEVNDLEELKNNVSLLLDVPLAMDEEITIKIRPVRGSGENNESG